MLFFFLRRRGRKEIIKGRSERERRKKGERKGEGTEGWEEGGKEEGGGGGGIHQGIGKGRVSQVLSEAPCVSFVNLNGKLIMMTTTVTTIIDLQNSSVCEVGVLNLSIRKSLSS